MAVADTSTLPDYAFSGFNPSTADVRPRVEDALGRQYHKPYDAGEWQMYCVDRITGKVIYLNDFVNSAQWIDDLSEVVITGTVELDNSVDIAGNRIADFVKKGSEIRLLVRHPVTQQFEEKERLIVWRRERTSGSSMTVSVYNHFKYLVDSTITCLYVKGKRKKDWTVLEITKDLAKKYGIPLSSLPKMIKTSAKVPYFYQEGERLLDVLLRLWTLEAKASSRKFMFRMFQGRMQIVVKPSEPKGMVVEISNAFNDGGMLTSASTSDDIDETKTIVRLWGTSKEFSDNATDARGAVVKSKQYANKAAVALWGRIYYEAPVDGITTQGAIDAAAKRVLKQKSMAHFTGRITIVGYPWLATSQAVRMNDPDSGAVGLFYLKTTTHSIDGNGSYTMSAALTRYDYTNALKTEASDLKPEDFGDQISAAGSSVDSSVGPKVSAIPQDIWQTLVLAAPAAGVPKEWANSSALFHLLQGESSFVWNNKNPSSTAYGLFQFLDSTWAGVGITKAQATEGYVAGGTYQFGSTVAASGKTSITINGVTVAAWKYYMCVAGLKYIKNRYRTPEQAWAFWQRQSPHFY